MLIYPFGNITSHSADSPSRINMWPFRGAERSESNRIMLRFSAGGIEEDRTALFTQLELVRIILLSCSWSPNFNCKMHLDMLNFIGLYLLLRLEDSCTMVIFRATRPHIHSSESCVCVGRCRVCKEELVGMIIAM
jgi:hypothetical protein